MLPTFRTMVIAVAAVFLALMVTARGLVTAPEAVTRIGEVPPLGRTLVQLAQVPLDDTQKRFVAEAVARAERAEIEAEARIQQADAAGRSVTADGAAAPRAPETASETASEIAADSRPAGGPSLPLVAADERRRPAAAVPASADPLGDLIRAVVPETPEPSPRPAGSGGDEGAGTVVALAAAPAAPPAPSPAMPPEPVAAGPAPADPVSADRTPADPVPADPERGAAAAAPGEAVVAALPTAEPAVVFGPERPAAKPTAQKAKRTAKPAARKKARANRPARRPVVRTVSRPVAPAPAATTYQTYTPFFGSPAATAQPAAQPGTLRR